MLDRKIVINELRKRGYIAEEKNVVKNGWGCDGNVSKSSVKFY